METRSTELQRRLDEAKSRMSTLKERTEEYWELKAEVYTLSIWLRQPEVVQSSQHIANKQ